MKKKQEVKPADWKFFAVLVAVSLALGGAIFYLFGPRPDARATREQVPPYFISAEAAKPFPQTLDPSQFSDKDIAAAYLVAKKAPEVLAQQPCFCHCHRSGHRSLLDCFATKHGAECDMCVSQRQDPGRVYAGLCQRGFRLCPGCREESLRTERKGL